MERRTGKKIKKAACYVMALLICLQLAGCGGAKQTETESAGSLTYHAGEELSGTGMYLCFAFRDGALYGVKNAAGETVTVPELFRAKMGGGEAEMLPAERLADTCCPELLAAGEDGSIVLYVYDEAEASFMLYGMGAGGQELFYTAVQDTGDAAIRLLISGSEEIVLVREQTVQIFDRQGQMKKSIPCSTQISAAALSKDGAVVLGVTTMAGAEAWQLDTGTEKWTKKVRLDMETFTDGSAMADGLVYDFYYADDSFLYGFDYERNVSVKLLSCTDSCITAGSIGFYAAADSDTFVVQESGEDGDSCHSFHLVPEEELTECVTLTIGVMNPTAGFSQAVARFNREHTDCRVEVIDYQSYADPYVQMDMDIISGNAPDIFELGNATVEQYCRLGLLEDLTPYFAGDVDVSLDDYMDNVREAVTVDGSVPYVVSGFSIVSMMAASSDVGGAEGWTPEEMLALMGKKGDSRPFYINLKTGILGALTFSSIDGYIDWDTGKTSFDSDSFKNLLRAANTGIPGEETDFHEVDSELKMIQQGKVFLARIHASDLSDVLAYQRAFDAEVSFVGYPSEDRQGSYFVFEDMLGMNAHSEHKDAAWEFLKIFATKEYEYRYVKGAFPARKDCFDMLVEHYQAAEAYTDACGNPANAYSAVVDTGDVNFTFGAASEEDIALLKRLVSGTHKHYEANSVVTEIIMEETPAYFNGERTLDEVAELIENRVSTYVNENR